jgi:predicted SnoaL-like aldol condensation-catalyzing enzyme
MNTKDPKITALQFNQCITDHDLEALARLMTDDHAFVESDGTIHQPKQDMVEKWRQFFEAFPNYKNTFDRVQSKDNLVVMLGFAFWSEQQPYDPAIWVATIIDDLVREWRIHLDTPENRTELGLV